MGDVDPGRDSPYRWGMTKVASLPGGLIDRPEGEDVEDEVRTMKGTSMAQRARILEDLCRMAAEFTAQHADPQRVLDWQDPVSQETEELLRRLREAHANHD